MNIEINLTERFSSRLLNIICIDEWLPFEVNGKEFKGRLHNDGYGAIQLDIFEVTWDEDISDKCLLSLGSKEMPWELLGMLLDHAGEQKDG